MTLSFRGAEWYDFSSSHISLSFTIGWFASNFPSNLKAKETDSGVFDFDVFSPYGSEAELASKDTSVVASFDADFTYCVYTSGFVPS